MEFCRLGASGPKRKRCRRFQRVDTGVHPLARVHQSYIWQGFISGLKAGELYKYALETDSGEVLFKADPMAVADELPPGTASKLW